MLLVTGPNGQEKTEGKLLSSAQVLVEGNQRKTPFVPFIRRESLELVFREEFPFAARGGSIN